MIIRLLFFIIFINSCQPHVKNIILDVDKMVVEEILFYPFSHGLVDNPNELNEDMNIISINNDKAYKIHEKYKDNKLIKTDTVNIIKISLENKKIISNISEKYLHTNQVFGYPNMADDGSLGVTVVLKNGKNIFWELSYRKNQHPKEIQLVYEMYEEVQQKLNKK